MLGLPVSEIFGPTLQGEGPAAGRPAWFVRLGGCNLSCSWCDTPYTWDGRRYPLRAELTEMHPGEIAAALPADPGLVILTGGEPLIHQRSEAWELMLRAIHGEMHLETNGTLPPSAPTAVRMAHISVSPKLPHAGDHGGRSPALHPSWVTIPEAILKIVVRTPEEVWDVATGYHDQGWARSRIWVMPEGMTAAALATRWPDIAQAAADCGINATHRLHVLAWGQERGH